MENKCTFSEGNLWLGKVEINLKFNPSLLVDM